MRYLIAFFLLFNVALAENISKEGKGFLQQINGQLVLHLKGTPYERGFQHGKLLKDLIQSNIEKFIDKKSSEQNAQTEAFFKNLPNLVKYIPPHFIDEMKGIAEGSGIAYQKILTLNLFPELFHCCGFTVTGEASKNKKLYHARVLDYSIGKDLQQSAVMMVVEPDEHYSYLNVSYAGFIGCVTGMNNQKIALGEIGGQGYGFWNGVPMAFLLREILENAETLDDAKDILTKNPRTCEYYYVISDGKTNSSFGVYATESQIHFIEPGIDYALMAPQGLPKNYGSNGLNDKFFLSHFKMKVSNYQTAIFQNDKKLVAFFHKQPQDCLILIGFATPNRYPILVNRLLEGYGFLDEHLIKQVLLSPCSMNTNLHNAIFLPADLKVWVSHAGPGNEPACDQPYFLFELDKLLTAQ